MNPQLVKIDVAAADLGKAVAHIFGLVFDGGNLLEPGIHWVFNFANALDSRRDLRFWRPEIKARADGEAEKFSAWEIGQVVAKILPATRKNFHAGEVDQLFQIRKTTRLDFGAELAGRLDGGRNFYSRATLENFLCRRWLGAMHERKAVRP